MKLPGLLADVGAMSNQTLTAPPEETTAAEKATESATSSDVAEASPRALAPAEPRTAPSAEPAGPATENSLPGDPGVKDELIAKFEAEAAAEAAAPAGRVARLLTLPLRLAVWVFVMLDLPFGFLGEGAKRMIGVVAVFTALMAAATWIGGPRLAAALTVPAGEQPAAVSEAKESGEKVAAGSEAKESGEKAQPKHGEESAAKKH